MFGKLPTAKYYTAMAMAQVQMGFQWAIFGIGLAGWGGLPTRIASSLAALFLMSSVLYDILLYNVSR